MLSGERFTDGQRPMPPLHSLCAMDHGPITTTRLTTRGLVIMRFARRGDLPRLSQSFPPKPLRRPQLNWEVERRLAGLLPRATPLPNSLDPPLGPSLTLRLNHRGNQHLHPPKELPLVARLFPHRDLQRRQSWLAGLLPRTDRFGLSPHRRHKRIFHRDSLVDHLPFQSLQNNVLPLQGQRTNPT